MAENKIEYNKLVGQEDPFDKIIEKAEAIIEVFGKVEVSIKSAMSQLKKGVNGGTSNVNEVQQLDASIKKTHEYAEAQKKVSAAKKTLTIDVAKARVEQENYNKLVKNSAKDEAGLISEYQKQSIALNDLRNKYKDLVLTNQQNTEAGKILLKNVTELDTKLKAVDATVGQHQRNVGNYSGAITKLSKGLGGLTGLVSTLGAAFGLETEQLEKFHEISRELIKTGRELHHATELEEVSTLANGAAHEEATVAKEAEIVTNEELAASELGVVGVIGLVVVAIAAAGVAIYDYIKGKEEQEIAEDMANQAMDGSIIKTKELRDAYNETIISIRHTNDELAVMNGKMTEQAAKIDEIKLKNKVAIRDIQNEMQTKLNEAGPGFWSKLFFGDVATANAFAEKVKIFKEYTDKAAAEQLKANNEVRAVDLEETKKNHADLIKEEEDYRKKLRDLQIANIEYSYERKRAEVLAEYDDESKKYKGHNDILVELEIRKNQQLKKLWEEREAENIRILKEGQVDYVKAVKDDAKKMEQENKDPELSPKFIAQQKQYAADDKAKKDHDKKVKDSDIALADDLLKIEKEYQDKDAEIQLKAIDAKIEKNKSAIDVQTALAAAGRDNNLAYELKKQDDLEKQRVAELERQKKMAKEQEALALGLAFIKAYEKDIDAGMKPGAALANAATETLAAKLLSKSIAGSALEGTEDTGASEGPGIDGKGGRLWVLHEHEAVATKKANEENPGLVGAMNKGMVQDYFENIYKPNYKSSIELADVSIKKQAGDAMLSLLDNRLQSLERTIKNKVENSYNFDALGRLIHDKIENGIRTTTIKKTHLES